MFKASQDSSLTIRLFGRFEVLLNGVPLPKMRTRKEKWLLALLVLAEGREVSRQSLNQKLWPDEEDQYPLDPSYNLRRSLTGLRKGLGDQSHRLISTEYHSLRFDLTGADIDLFSFRRAIDHESLSVSNRLELLTALYRGSLLSECTDDWIKDPRESYQQAYHKALLILSERAVQEGEYHIADRSLRLASRLYRASEATQRVLMQALGKLGSYEEALLIYEDLTHYLRYSFNAVPSPETTRLYQILQKEAQKRPLLPLPSSTYEMIEIKAEDSNEKRARALLQRTCDDWILFGRTEGLLSAPDTLAILLEYPNAFQPTADQLEFLLCSLLASSRSSPGNPDTTSHLTRIFRQSNQVSNLFMRLIQQPNARLRFGMLNAFLHLPEDITGSLIAEGILSHIVSLLLLETDRDVKRAGLRTLTKLGGGLPEEVAERLVESEEEDWIVRSYALRSLRGTMTLVREDCPTYVSSAQGKKGCLLLSDGTEFARELGEITREHKFTMIQGPRNILLPSIEEQDDKIFDAYSLILLIRGEHFTQWTNVGFYSRLRRFVAEGGILFATSWVSWETITNTAFAELLPFEHIGEGYSEDVSITWYPTSNAIAKQLSSRMFHYQGSFENLRSREGSIVLAVSETGTPLLGYRPFGKGICYYLNTCQHTCFGKMLSPLHTSVDFQTCMQRLFHKLNEDTEAHRRNY